MSRREWVLVDLGDGKTHYVFVVREDSETEDDLRRKAREIVLRKQVFSAGGDLATERPE